MTEDSVILLERKFIKASVVTYFTAYIAGSLMSALAWPGVTSLNAAEFWMFWPVNLRYIIQISANFGSTDGWNGFLFSNYIISSLMIIRMAYLFSVELSKPRDSFTWGITTVHLMVIPFALIALFLPFREGPRSYGLTFYDGPFGSSLKSNFLVAIFYFGITDPIVKLVSWLKFSLRLKNMS
ncbi:hypothetical protein KHC17_01635 [Agrobacterium salinitolerans]|uniref:hypothetical protein n=1 Tax=Agrobacterium salinitolerans TaxID=1183413 RepID=UPI001C23A4A4|nr:hypothetical protein [Agrobacterium salinitolerans]QXC48836.1 hypothetical protein KHC17_01635 [Agrobacterium salinitolerans]